MVLFTRILYRTRVPHATSKSVLNTAPSSHLLPRYVHQLAVTFYVSGRFHATNRYGAHTASPTGTHAREARAPRRVLACTYPLYMLHDMSRTPYVCVYIYIYIYIGFLGDTRCAQPPPLTGYTYTPMYALVHYSLIRVCI